MAGEDETSSPGGERSDAEDGEENEVELLVQGRAKRSTAGNRLNTLLNIEHDEDDVVELLFAEQEGEDDDFHSEAEQGSDVEMDSSSDDDDQGPAAGADDLDGERELEQQAKAERRKERKKLEAPRRLPQRRMARAAGRGAVASGTDAGSSSMAPPPKPDSKRKSDRTTWLLPTDGFAVRASSRKQTVQNKEVTQQRIKESETRRARTLRAMEAANRKKEEAAARSRNMTQEERMAEAARVERVNAKSLNRWQAEEARRAEERRAKLAALKDRKLDGPFVTLWSGPAVWVDGKLRGAGAKQIEDVTATEDAKLKAQEEKVAKAREAEANAELAAILPLESATNDAHRMDTELADQEVVDAMSGVTVTDIAHVPDVDQMDLLPDSLPEVKLDQPQPSEEPSLQPIQQSQPSPEHSGEQAITIDEAQRQTALEKLEDATKLSATFNIQNSVEESSGRPTPQADTPMQDSQGVTPEAREAPPADALASNGALSHSPSEERPSEDRLSTPQPALIEVASRTLVALHNVDATSFPDHVLAHTAMPRRKNARITGKQAVAAMCPITGQSARFRDPRSGVPYHDIKAFNQLRKLYRQDDEQALSADGPRFSEMLGCFVGGNQAAKGVPEKFRQYRKDQSPWTAEASSDVI